jgi:hypothetical protein
VFLSIAVILMQRNRKKSLCSMTPRDHYVDWKEEKMGMDASRFPKVE